MVSMSDLISGCSAIGNKMELCIRMCFSFFVSHAKSGITNNHRTELSDI